MRFVELKTPEQVDVQALHRIRDQLVATRTRLICQMRAFCLEYGVALRQGGDVFKLDLPKVVAELTNDLTPTMRRLLADLFDDLKRLEMRIESVRRELEALAASDDRARRLMMIPGIGPLGFTAPSQRQGTGSSLKRHGIWPPGWDWCRNNTPPEADPNCSASANVGITLCAGY